jgi:hypothetical protein
MNEELELALEELADRFEMAGAAVWTGGQVADPTSHTNTRSR